jgi:hypothetical protein
MAYDTLPIHGNPDQHVFGVIGAKVSSGDGGLYIKSELDTLNVGWRNISSSAPPVVTQTPTTTLYLTPTPTITPTITPTPNTTATPAVTPSITPTQTVTPTIPTPSVTPTNTVTPTVSPSNGAVYYTLYTTSSVDSLGPSGETPGDLTIYLWPPGGTYVVGTEVTITASPDSNSSASLYKDGVLVSTSTSSIVTTITMNSHHTASARLGWRNIPWEVIASPANCGSPYGSGGFTSGYVKKGETLYINAQPTGGSTFISWSYTDSVPASTTNVATTAVISQEGANRFTANYVRATYWISATYSGFSGTSSFAYYDSIGTLYTITRSGIPGGSPPPMCGVLYLVYEGEATQTETPCVGAPSTQVEVTPEYSIHGSGWGNGCMYVNHVLEGRTHATDIESGSWADLGGTQSLSLPDSYISDGTVSEMTEASPPFHYQVRSVFTTSCGSVTSTSAVGYYNP